MTLQLGDTAPDFEADTTEGPIRFHDWIGDSWAVLFSHPKDFTPVCTTELGYMAKIKPEFDRARREDHRFVGRPDRATTSVGERHRGDAGPRAELPDDRRRRLQGVEALRDAAGRHRGRPEERTPADNQTVRNVFVIGPDKKIKLILVYPMTTGRNFDEVLRVIDSLQLTAKHQVATPVNWKPGEDVIIAGSVSDDEAKRTYPQGWKAPSPTSASCRSRAEHVRLLGPRLTTVEGDSRVLPAVLARLPVPAVVSGRRRDHGAGRRGRSASRRRGLPRRRRRPWAAIERVIETHFHADFLLGSPRARRATGAVICLRRRARGPTSRSEYLTDGQRLDLGEVRLEIRATPGHTPSRSASWSTRTPTTHAVRRADRRRAVHRRRRPTRPARGLRVDPGDWRRSSTARCRGKLLTLPDGHPGVPGTRGGLGVREEPVHRDGSPPSASSGATNYACPDDRGPVRSRRDRGPAGRRRRTSPSTPVLNLASSTRSARRPADAPVRWSWTTVLDDSRRPGRSCSTPAIRSEFAAGHLRRVGERPARRPVRRVRRLVIAPRPARRGGLPPQAARRVGAAGPHRVRPGAGYLRDPQGAFLTAPERVVRASSRLTRRELARRCTATSRRVVVDVRNRRRTDRRHVPGSINVPLAQLRRPVGEIPPGPSWSTAPAATVQAWPRPPSAGAVRRLRPARRLRRLGRPDHRAGAVTAGPGHVAGRSARPA